ncbi:MAG: uroporphyrinogen-III C-methyltransferase [Rhodobiaceae bacterium]|nr:uroporphyrinogen-III C-methyltransferase [Rhodobiaceae bacterium]MCC0055633.1 uroporphyrinogen-III C-methyltransferase [Rhodobiaceae bacterium]
MRHFPIYLDLKGRKVVVSGAGAFALPKLRLLLKTEAVVEVYGADAAPEVKAWAQEGRLRLDERALAAGDAGGAVLLYGANDDEALDRRAAEIGRAAGALVNIVDNLEESEFITPAIVDRDPVTVAIGTEGAAPVLARKIKADVEEMLPPSTGLLARIAETFRAAVTVLPEGRARRNFWSRYFASEGQRALDRGGEAAVRQRLSTMLDEVGASADPKGQVALIGTGPGDPELMTLKARRLLQEADVVLYDTLVTPEILELARREAVMIHVGKKGYGKSVAQDEINRLAIEHARAGAHVARLKGGDPVIFGRLDEEIEALDEAGIEWEVVPGITAASAAAAGIGKSLTRRGRNSSLNILTGHDVDGFAEQDWQKLARPGSAAAIYMGLKASTFIQGRLMMHGADPSTPVTIVENASRDSQKVVSTVLGSLEHALKTGGILGPAVILYGLKPHAALGVLETIAPTGAQVRTGTR